MDFGDNRGWTQLLFQSESLCLFIDELRPCTFMVTIAGCFTVPVILLIVFLVGRILFLSLGVLELCWFSALIIMDFFLGLLCPSIPLLKCVLPCAVVIKTVFHLCVKHSFRLQWWLGSHELPWPVLDLHVLISPSILKGSFAGSSDLGWQLLPLRIWKTFVIISPWLWGLLTSDLMLFFWLCLCRRVDIPPYSFRCCIFVLYFCHLDYHRLWGGPSLRISIWGFKCFLYSNVYFLP